MHVRHNRTTLCTTDLPLGIQNCSLNCGNMWPCPAWASFWWSAWISNWVTWCFVGTIKGNLASNAMGALEMRPPILKHHLPTMAAAQQLHSSSWRSLVSSSLQFPLNKLQFARASLWDLLLSPNSLLLGSWHCRPRCCLYDVAGMFDLQQSCYLFL